MRCVLATSVLCFVVAGCSQSPSAPSAPKTLTITPVAPATATLKIGVLACFQVDGGAPPYSWVFAFPTGSLSQNTSPTNQICLTPTSGGGGYQLTVLSGDSQTATLSGTVTK